MWVPLSLRATRVFAGTPMMKERADWRDAIAVVLAATGTKGRRGVFSFSFGPTQRIDFSGRWLSPLEYTKKGVRERPTIICE